MLEVALAIPYWLELAATVAGALFGAMSAVQARYDIFGVSCIAIVTGLAGGLLRDVLLQNYGIYAFQKPSLIVACVGAGVFVFYFSKLVTYFDPIADLLDNLSVALWAIIGTGKALSAGLDIVPAIILGTVTANGGGIVRDICMNREPQAFQAGTLYVSAALIGCIAYALMRSNHILDQYAAISCVVLVLGVRYLSLLFGWTTKPAERDYSDLVTRAVTKPVRVAARPVKAAAQRARPPKGKVERDKERRRTSDVLRRVLQRLNGSTTTSSQPAHSAKPDTTDRIVVNREELRKIKGETDDAPRDPFEPRS